MRQAMWRVARFLMRVSGRCALAFALASAHAALAADDACNAEIAQMHGDRGEIASRAEAVAAALDQLETCARQSANAVRIGESCKRQEADYRQAVALLNAAINRTDARIRRIAISCVKDGEGRAVEPPPPAREAPPREPPPPPRETQQPPPRGALQPAPGVNASCDLARSYKGKIPFDGVLRICERSMSGADCRVCLGPE